jgi:ABC-type lipoprotein export system ATPase subunit/GNAT superfamily N-acetyltransferase
MRNYKVAFPVSPENSSLLVAEAFGIFPGWVNTVVDVQLPEELPAITLITGESGCGKSTLLTHKNGLALQITPFAAPSTPLHGWAKTDEESLRLLNAVGLNDASLFVLKYNQLSDSQRARAHMYLWLCNGVKTLVIDEFLATLDRKTAQALAFSFQKMLRREGIKLVAVTAHDDIVPYLQADLVVRGTAFPSDWKTVQRTDSIKNPFSECIAVRQEQAPSEHETPGGMNCQRSRIEGCDCAHPRISISPGKDAYRESRLGEIHYKGKYIGGRQEYFSARLGAQIVGWLVGTVTRSGGYRIARVVVHPTYRGCGVGQRLIKAYIKARPKCDTVAAMARFNPVFERAGMRRLDDIKISPPKILANIGISALEWASPLGCEKFLSEHASWHKLVVDNCDTFKVDLHPGGRPLTREALRKYLTIPEHAAYALWKTRPRTLAKYIS